MNQFSPLFTCSLINLLDLRYNRNELISFLSSILALLVLTIIFIGLALIILRIHKLSQNLSDETRIEFKLKFSLIISGLRETSSESIVFFWRPLILLRQALTIIILVILRNNPALQILILLILSVLSQIMIFKYQPYDSRLTNVVTFINELAVSVYLYLSILLSDFV